MEDGRLIKMEQDMSSACDELLPQAEARAKVRGAPPPCGPRSSA